MRLMSNVGWSMPAPTMTRMPPRFTWLKAVSMAARCPAHSRTTWEARAAWRDARPGDAVHGHRQRFGQRGVAGVESIGQTQHAGGAGDDVLREGAVAVLRRHGVAVLALRGLALAAAPARPALGRGAADHQFAHRPPGHFVAHGGDGAAPLVAADHARREAPAVAHLVDVRAADGARETAH